MKRAESSATSVFLDPTGRRAARARILGIALAVVTVAVLAAFLVSLYAGPRLQSGGAGPHRPHSKIASRQFATVRKALFTRIAADERAAKRPAVLKGPQISGAYFAPWEEAGLDSFQAHAAALTHVYPVWIALAQDGRSIVTTDWNPARNAATASLIRIARTNGVRIVPVVANAIAGEFDAGRVRAMLKDPAAQAAVATSLLQFVTTNKFDGIQIDFELLDAPDLVSLTPWLAKLGRDLHAQGKELSITVEADMDAAAVKGLAAAVDYVVVMAYDEHEDKSPPGPVASTDFVNRTLKRFIDVIGREKFVLAIGGFGYDWTVGGQSAVSVTNMEAIALAEGYRDNEKPQDVIDFDPTAMEPTFQYVDENDARHEVWFLDGASAANAEKLAKSYGVRGSALWALGTEDPSMWKAFGRLATAKPDLHQVVFPQQVQFIGDGELLRVTRTPHPGSRIYDTDPISGLITDETYTSYPSGWIVEQRGALPKALALTFDDGPDPTWTPQILDILKRHNVKATFFMIGEEAAARPDLVRRVFADGHEIGNHSFTHPNMAHTGTERIKLELVTTQRALQAILGRSTTLFRPPYNADSEPRSYGEIAPVAVAGDEGYVTAGEAIDPQDWETRPVGPDGQTHKLTGPEIVQSVLQNVDKGHAVLLHDSGGDRSATVAALDSLITSLEQRGYRFVTMGELEGRGRDLTMPKLSAADRRVALVDSVVFTISRVIGAFLFWGFVLAVALGLVRIAMMIGLASRRRRRAPKDGEPLKVDVLVAAYNEETVVARTIESLLASRGVDVRVIVIDDGSSDATGAVVEEAFGADPRVLLLRKPNGGKASALNLGLEHATAPVIVGVDADTQLSGDALARLAAWFVYPDIGAVAGNVKVGNARGLVARWQSVEYVTSQNIDRRALASVNAVTVVPGAIGAWRLEALRAVGGYRSDTLAEDMDLTWRVRLAGWKITAEPAAIAYTEAPDTMAGLLKQRFRWTYGTLQCLWKHRSALFHHGWFGWFALPSLWLFQIAAQVLAPLVDLQLLIMLLGVLQNWIAHLQHSDVSVSPNPMLWLVVTIYIAFLVLEAAAGWIAYALDRADPRDLALLFTQRFVYRQIMYVVVWRSLLRASGGVGHAWGKLRRTGAVTFKDSSAS